MLFLKILFYIIIFYFFLFILTCITTSGLTKIHEYLEIRKKEENKVIYKSKAKPKEYNNNLKFNKSLGIWEEE